MTSGRPLVHLVNVSGVTLDYNDYFSTIGNNSLWFQTDTQFSAWPVDAWSQNTTFDKHSFYQDPLLDPANLYRPLASSPVIDRGAFLADVAFDYAGNKRPQGATDDIGAFESSATGTPVPVVTPPVTTPSSSSATFVKVDRTTQGNWRNAYGGDGYVVIGDQAANPSYANPVPSGNQLYTWASSTGDIRALQKGSNGADRIASTWYGWNTFTIDLNVTDQVQHQLALYFSDWDRSDRREKVDILDASGNVLDTQQLSTSFNGGAYLVWNVTGKVKVRVTLTGGLNYVISGIFFGTAGTATAPVTTPVSANPTASFVKFDTTTKGNWTSAYGAEGYTILGDQTLNPSYASPVPSGQQFFLWGGSTSDPRGLQKASNPGDRVAGTWFTWNTFVIDLNFTDQAQHQVALYCVDWERTDRRQTVDILDANGNVLNSQSITSSFNGGVYLVWNLTGKVKMRVTLTGGLNAVISGLFFGGPSNLSAPAGTTASFVKADRTTRGNWIGAYGADGYTLVGDQTLKPSYANVIPSGNQFFVWAASTADSRGLQKPLNPSDRLADTWFSWGSMIIDPSITDQAQHQVALYCVDWDTVFRAQTIDVLDQNGKVLDTQSLTGFNGGVYMVWNVTGKVRFRLNLTGGLNTLVSGIFFR
jgi:hypothetical protein